MNNTNCDKLNVVFDVDGVIVDINKKICKKHNIDISKIVKHNIRTCEGLTETEKDTLISEYGSHDLYDDIELEDGADEIMELAPKCNLLIYSVCFNRGISLSKYRMLTERLNIAPENIELLIKDKDGTKPAHGKADIIVEDCLDNIINYTKDTVKILLNKPYNQTDLDDEYGIIRVANIRQAIKIIKSKLSDAEQ